MNVKIMGLAMYTHENERKLKITCNKDGVVTSFVTVCPTGKLSIAKVRNITVKSMKVKPKNLHIPKHIKLAIDGKE